MPWSYFLILPLDNWYFFGIILSEGEADERNGHRSQARESGRAGCLASPHITRLPVSGQAAAAPAVRPAIPILETGVDLVSPDIRGGGQLGHAGARSFGPGGVCEAWCRGRGWQY